MQAEVNPVDERHYRKIGPTSLPSVNTFGGDFPEKIADHFVKNNNLSSYKYINSERIDKDLKEIYNIPQPEVRHNIITEIRKHPEVEAEPESGSFNFQTHDFNYWLKHHKK